MCIKVSCSRSAGGLTWLQEVTCLCGVTVVSLLVFSFLKRHSDNYHNIVYLKMHFFPHFLSLWDGTINHAKTYF